MTVVGSSTGEPAGGGAVAADVRPEGTPMLEVRDLHVSYDQVAALRGLSVTVHPGEFVVLLGPNGAGKTTTLRSISGLLKPSSGKILWEGEDATRWSAVRMTATGIGHVPEARHIFPDHTVEENLQLGAYTLRRRRGEREETLEEVYSLFPRLAERRGQQGGTLSGGEAQMLAVARALMSRPRLLMLDEPSLGLAPMLVREMFQYLSRLHRQQGLTILLVEQAAMQALRAVDRGYVLEQGAVVIEGTAAQLREDEGVQRVYLGGGALT